MKVIVKRIHNNVVGDIERMDPLAKFMLKYMLGIFLLALSGATIPTSLLKYDNDCTLIRDFLLPAFLYDVGMYFIRRSTVIYMTVSVNKIKYYFCRLVFWLIPNFFRILCLLSFYMFLSK